MIHNINFSENIISPRTNEPLVAALTVGAVVLCFITVVIIMLIIVMIAARDGVDANFVITGVFAAIGFIGCVVGGSIQYNNDNNAIDQAIMTSIDVTSIKWHEDRSFFSAKRNDDGNYIFAKLVEVESGTFSITPIQP